MPNRYLHPEWIKFRDEVVELDGFECKRCGRLRSGGAILQVHHLTYEHGKKPWEYCYNQCETLCKACHAAEHGHIPPREGWSLFGWDDLEDLIGKCDRCGSAFRYAFHVYHPHWEPMVVGTVCCDRMTGTNRASVQTDHFQRREDRILRFLNSPRWRCDSYGCEIRQKGIRVRVQRFYNGYRLVLNQTVGKQTFPEIELAKRFAFDFIDSGEAKKYFDQN